MKVTPNHLQAVIEALVVGLVRRGSSKRKVGPDLLKHDLHTQKQIID